MIVYIDWSYLNNNTIIYRYPIPCIDYMLDKLEQAITFGKIDLASGYHQVEMHPDHYYKTAFQTKSGLSEYVVIPLGLNNSLV